MGLGKGNINVNQGLKNSIKEELQENNENINNNEKHEKNMKQKEDNEW